VRLENTFLRRSGPSSEQNRLSYKSYPPKIPVHQRPTPVIVSPHLGIADPSSRIKTLKTLSLSGVWISISLHGEGIDYKEIAWGQEYFFLRRLRKVPVLRKQGTIPIVKMVTRKQSGGMLRDNAAGRSGSQDCQSSCRAYLPVDD
jgi:hypothetical protein